ncbi:selenocysteine lyase isoform X3 [Physeter macrocephalus]|uniref:Selenocysteine lyase n=1 Tax=Physeter macrocephalus TaxID=9755 RepID=A0A455ASF8_PHYMC|nr:selenocysteine lyase isoform X3 [Physeter catodon]|eukprot:XP_028338838.1 selenocysteine lyase isoform X3 [Physeter catodon]
MLCRLGPSPGWPAWAGSGWRRPGRGAGTRGGERRVHLAAEQRRARRRGATGLIPGRGAKIPHAAGHGQKKTLHGLKNLCFNSHHCRKVYMDYNATTPLEPEVIQAMTEAMQEAWGNPSSPYPAGRKAKEIINAARENLAKMIGGRPQDMIFTSGGTESNNLVIHSVVKHFHKIHAAVGDTAEHPSPVEGALPHIITCTVEHDSIRLPLEHLVEEQVAEVTFVPVSKVNGQAEAEDILAAVRPATCLVTIMLANNETGVVMPVPEISRRVRALNQQRAAGGLPGVLVHTDAAQALGKRRVDVRDLGVDFLTVVGHKFYGPRVGALYVRGLGELTPLYPMLFGGGQERNFRPGTENTPMIAGLGKLVEEVPISPCDLLQRWGRVSPTGSFSASSPVSLLSLAVLTLPRGSDASLRAGLGLDVSGHVLTCWEAHVPAASSACPLGPRCVLLSLPGRWRLSPWCLLPPRLSAEESRRCP